jgi:hypothetical protein
MLSDRALLAIEESNAAELLTECGTVSAQASACSFFEIPHCGATCYHS